MLDFELDERLASASTLPSRCYTDARFLELERDRVFGRTWQLVGRRESAAAPGQFLTAEIAGEPILIACGEDGRPRAFSNVCTGRDPSRRERAPPAPFAAAITVGAIRSTEGFSERRNSKASRVSARRTLACRSFASRSGSICFL